MLPYKCQIAQNTHTKQVLTISYESLLAVATLVQYKEEHLFALSQGKWCYFEGLD